MYIYIFFYIYIYIYIYINTYSLSSLISSSIHSHVPFYLELCDIIKVSNLLLPRKSGTFKSLQPLSTLGTLWDLRQLGSRSLGPPDVRTISMQWTHSMANWINVRLPLFFGILRLRTRLQQLESLPTLPRRATRT